MRACAKSTIPAGGACDSCPFNIDFIPYCPTTHSRFAFNWPLRLKHNNVSIAEVLLYCLQVLAKIQTGKNGRPR